MPCPEARAAQGVAGGGFAAGVSYPRWPRAVWADDPGGRSAPACRPPPSTASARHRDPAVRRGAASRGPRAPRPVASSCYPLPTARTREAPQARRCAKPSDATRGPSTPMPGHGQQRSPPCSTRTRRSGATPLLRPGVAPPSPSPLARRPQPSPAARPDRCDMDCHRDKSSDAVVPPRPPRHTPVAAPRVRVQVAARLYRYYQFPPLSRELPSVILRSVSCWSVHVSCRSNGTLRAQSVQYIIT